MSYDNYAIKFVFWVYQFECSHLWQTIPHLFAFGVIFPQNSMYFAHMTAALISSLFENILSGQLQTDKQHDATLEE